MQRTVCFLVLLLHTWYIAYTVLRYLPSFPLFAKFGEKSCKTGQIFYNLPGNINKENTLCLKKSTWKMYDVGKYLPLYVSENFKIRSKIIKSVHVGNNFLIRLTFAYTVDLGAPYLKNRKKNYLDFFNSAPCMQLRLSPRFRHKSRKFGFLLVSMAKINMSICEKSTRSRSNFELYHFLSS